MSTFVPKRAVAVALALTTAIWLAGAALVVPVAQAQTVGELQAQINALLAQIAALQAQLGGAGGGCYNFTRDLFNGVGRGDDVKALQDYLTRTGHFTFSGGSTGFFGPITASAVASWQAANGVSPPAGYFGPISRAKYNSLCTAAPAPEAPEAELEGGDGYFIDFALLGAPSSETVFEGQSEKVLGFEYEAEGSDLRVERVRVRFDNSGSTTGDEEPWRYFESVALYHGDDKVAEEDAGSAGDWSEVSNNVYEKTFSGLSEITRQDQRSEWFVEVTTKNTIDSSNDGEDFTVSLQADSVRARNAVGADATGPSSALTETLTIDTDAQGKLDLSIDDADNRDRVVEVDDVNDTDNVVLLDFELEAEDSDVTVEDLSVDIATSSSYANTGSVGDLLSRACLYRTGTLVECQSIASAATSTTVTFDNIDQTVDSGDEETWQVKGTVKNIDGSTNKEGDVVVLDIDNADVDAKTANGDTATVTGGTITGGDVAFYSEGVSLSLVSASATKTVDGSSGNVDDEGQFTIVFDVSAFGSDIYVQDGASSSAIVVGGASGAGFTVTDGTVTSTVSATFDSNGVDGASSTFKVGKNNTQRFTLTVSVTATTGTTDFVKVALNSLGWATSDQATGTAVYNFNLTEFETPSITLVPR